MRKGSERERVEARARRARGSEGEQFGSQATRARDHIGLDFGDNLAQFRSALKGAGATDRLPGRLKDGAVVGVLEDGTAQRLHLIHVEGIGAGKRKGTARCTYI